MTQHPEAPDYPYRLVDPEWHCWLHIRQDLYQGDGDRAWENLIPYEQLLAEHTPLRPVLTITDDDVSELTRLIAAAGRKATGSVLAGLYRATKALWDIKERDLPPKLGAGRPGSWETDRIRWLAWEVGSDLNDKPKRIHEETAAGIDAMLQRWATDPERYTEVAETLAHVFGTHADSAGGWPKVSDQWMQKGAVGWPESTRDYVVTYLLSTADCLDDAR